MRCDSAFMEICTEPDGDPVEPILEIDELQDAKLGVHREGSEKV